MNLFLASSAPTLMNRTHVPKLAELLPSWPSHEDLRFAGFGRVLGEVVVSGVHAYAQQPQPDFRAMNRLLSNGIG